MHQNAGQGNYNILKISLFLKYVCYRDVCYSYIFCVLSAAMVGSIYSKPTITFVATLQVIDGIKSVFGQNCSSKVPHCTWVIPSPQMEECTVLKATFCQLAALVLMCM